MQNSSIFFFLKKKKKNIYHLTIFGIFLYNFGGFFCLCKEEPWNLFKFLEQLGT
jgi:hypothetical protein